MIVGPTYQKLNSYASSYNRCLSFIRYFQRTFFGRTWTYLFVCYSFYRGQWIGRWLFICLLSFRLGLVACSFFFDCVGWIGRWFCCCSFFFPFFRSGSMDRRWLLGAVGCGTAGPITPLSSGKPLPERILLLKIWNFLR